MKTSIVYTTIKCIVRHEDDQDPEDVLCEANYEVVVEPDEGKQTPMIVETEMVETENRGECHPIEHYLLEDQRRDEKNGLYPQHEDSAN